MWRFYVEKIHQNVSVVCQALGLGALDSSGRCGKWRFVWLHRVAAFIDCPTSVLAEDLRWQKLLCFMPVAIEFDVAILCRKDAPERFGCLSGAWS